MHATTLRVLVLQLIVLSTPWVDSSECVANANACADPSNPRGTKSQTRDIDQPANFAGSCTGSREQNVPCTLASDFCSSDQCIYNDWVEESTCNPKPNACDPNETNMDIKYRGTKTRTKTIQQQCQYCPTPCPNTVTEPIDCDINVNAQCPGIPCETETNPANWVIAPGESCRSVPGVTECNDASVRDPKGRITKIKPYLPNTGIHGAPACPSTPATVDVECDFTCSPIDCVYETNQNNYQPIPGESCLEIATTNCETEGVPHIGRQLMSVPSDPNTGIHGGALCVSKPNTYRVHTRVPKDLVNTTPIGRMLQENAKRILTSHRNVMTHPSKIHRAENK